MNLRLLRREAAKRDLTAQWLWYAENVNVETADRFLEAVRETLQILTQQPRCGALVRTENPAFQSVRRMPVIRGFHAILLFYRPTEDGIELIRVLHGSRDLASELGLD